MAKYTLYLDESETFTSPHDRYFSVGGVIIDNSLLPAIANDLSLLKHRLWASDANADSHILHEKEIWLVQHGSPSGVTYNNIFRSKDNVRKLYAGLSSILKNHCVVTMGVCLSEKALLHMYNGGTNPKLTISLQLLLENYCTFLQRNNGVGNVCYESLQAAGNKPLRQRFYELEALGTMYYTPEFIQTHIGDICFVDKACNNAGLQLADFIPNTFGRVCAGLQPKHTNFKRTVLKLAYDGGISLPNKFGLKQIP